MRSNWVAGDGDLERLGLRGTRRSRGRRRSRPWMLATGGVATLATVVAVAGTVIGVGAAPALAVCDSSGGSCIDTTAETGPSVAILPLRSQGDDVLSVSNGGADGDTEVGVVGYLTSDDASASNVTAASADTTATVQLDRGQRREVRLQGVPATARAVIVQVGTSYSRSSWQKSRAACGAPTAPASAVPADSASASGAATAETAVADGTATVAASTAQRRCGTARVAFSGRHDHVTRAQVERALRRWASHTATAMPTTGAVADFTQTVDRARLAAGISPGPLSLTVSWQLITGAQQVSAVRVTRTGADGSTTGTRQIDRPARSGSYTMESLEADTSYTVTVAPVVSGTPGTPIAMTATTLAAGATAGPTPSPSASNGGSATPSASPSTAAPTTGAPSTPAPSASSSAPSSSAPTSSAPSSSAPGATGSAVPAANAYAGWTRVIGQDFGTDAPVGSFAAKYPGWAGYDGNTSGASGTRWNSSTTMSVANSVLRMRNWVSGGTPQAGALTPIVPGSGSWNQQAQLYGKYVVRFKADSVKGFKVAWLLWPSSGNWDEGEIDFPEANLDGTVNWSAHDVTGNPSNQTWGATSTRMGDGNWHTATTTWEPGKVTYELDGSVVKTVTDAKFIPTTPMRWDLQNEVSTDGAKPAANADGSVYVDWVAQYKRG